VGSVDPIPTDPNPTCVVMIVPAVPTCNVPVVIIPAVIRPVEELLISKLDAVTIPETNTLLHVRIPLMFASP